VPEIPQYLCETVPLVNPENVSEVEFLNDCSKNVTPGDVPEVEAILGKPDHRVIEFTEAHPPTQQTANSK
jgi:hypothetical protein